MRATYIAIVISFLVLISGCGTDSAEIPELDDPRLIKFAIERSGSIYSTRVGNPTRVLGVIATLRELDELDDTHEYGPARTGLDSPVFYFVIRTDILLHDHTGDPKEIEDGWLNTVFDVSTGQERRGGGGLSYLHHPEMVELTIPENLEQLVVDQGTLFPKTAVAGSPVTPAPPATVAP